jgi:2-polyprenyl-3-methyl-5-hydroxy-6-metoxy-1,4-benzoquinol methylase
LSASGPVPSYESYTEWKGWHLDFAFSEEDGWYFAKEFGAIARTGKKILEIGFGSGSFLAWAKQQGAEVYGVELQNEIVEAAKKHGFIAVDNIDELMAYRGDGFDAIVAIDVLEHLSSESMSALFRSCEKLLKPSGVLIARVPNGDSPFGRPHQHGDATHLSTVTPLLLSQAAIGTKLCVTEVRNAARVPVRGGFAHCIVKKIQFAVREVLNITIAKIYGYPHSALDHNMVLVLTRTS